MRPARARETRNARADPTTLDAQPFDLCDNRVFREKVLVDQEV